VTYLLDTCTFIWLCTEPGKLSDAAREAIDGSDSILVLSDASVLEITLKWGAGKIGLPDPPRHWVEEQMRIWALDSSPISRQDMYRSSELPEHHRDPFDRLLVAATLNLNATLLTPDTLIHRYPVSCRW